MKQMKGRNNLEQLKNILVASVISTSVLNSYNYYNDEGYCGVNYVNNVSCHGHLYIA